MRTKKLWLSMLIVALMMSVATTFWTMVSGQQRTDAENENQNGGFIAVDSLFSTENGVSLKTNQSTPVYVEQVRNGVSVQSKNAKKLKYTKAINVSDNTKDDLLFEMQITPEESGNIELKQFLIRFEDWNNPGCYFEISLTNYPWGQSALGIVSAKTNTVSQYRGTSYKINSVKGPDGKVSYYEVTTSNTTDAQHGTVIECAFDGRNATAYHSVSNSVKFYYDNAEKALYAGNVYDWSGTLTSKGYNTDGKIKVLDMDLQSDMGSTKSAIWEGFESDFVRLSVETVEMNADFANYMIFTIDNQTMEGSIVNDTTPPEIEVDIDENNVPYGVKGEGFYFADAVCYDEMYENNTYVVKKVYFEGQEIKCSEKGFVPTESGKYEIKYIGSDYVGNRTSKTIVIEVLDKAKPVEIVFDKSSIDDGALELSKSAPSKADLFAETTLPEASVVGASGKTKIEITVTHNGDLVSVNNGKFIPYDEGFYIVTYKFTDELGNVYVFDYEVDVSFTGKAVVKPVVIEKYMLDGNKYRLPKVSYSLVNRYGEKIETAETYIKVLNKDTGSVLKEYGSETDVLFIPEKKQGDNLEIVYGAKYDGRVSEIRYEVTVLKSECLGDRFMAEEGVTRTINDYSITFSATQDKKGFSFTNRILIEDLMLQFSIPETQNNFEKLNIYINSFEKKNESVKLTLLKNPDKSVMLTDVYANGEYLGQCKGNFHKTAPMDFILKFDGVKIYDSNDDLIGRLTTTQNGKAFNGFTGRYADIRFEFEGVGGESAVSLVYVNNQMMGDFTNADDYMQPGIFVTDSIVTQFSVGDRLIVPRILVYDAFDSLPVITVNLKDANGNVCFEKKFLFGETDEIEHVFTKYGEYILNITAEDSSGNSYTYMGGIAVYVTYNVKPIIHIDGEVKKEAGVNERVVLPKITVYDIKDGIIDYCVYVCSPDGRITKIGNSFIPASKGVFSVYIYAVNSSGNVAVSETFIITVS